MKKQEKELNHAEILKAVSGGISGMLTGKKEEEIPKPKQSQRIKGKSSQLKEYKDFFEPTIKKQSAQVLIRISQENEQSLKRLHQLGKLSGCNLPFYAYLDNIIEYHLKEYEEK